MSGCEAISTCKVHVLLHCTPASTLSSFHLSHSVCLRVCVCMCVCVCVCVSAVKIKMADATKRALNWPGRT